MYVDIHCHMDLCADTAGAITRAEAADVRFILTQGTDMDSNKKALSLEKEYDIVRAALGLYPTDAMKLSDDEIAALLAWIEEQKPVAIGEVGLDYHWDDTQKERMKVVFSKILDLAERISRPVIIHSRKAENDVIEMLEQRQGKVLADMHCFSGSLKLAKRAAALGCYFSIPANINKSTHFQRLVEETPLEQLLTETDSPWLSPDDQENEPKNVVETVAVIAKLKSISVEQAKAQLWKNAMVFLQ